MGFGKGAYSGSWGEDDIDSQFPASAFNFEKPAHQRQSPSAPTNITDSHQTILDDADDVLSHLPCRKLNEWYLVAKPNRAFGYFAQDLYSFPRRRTPLPLDTQDLENYILLGTLHPRHPGQEPIKVELLELDFYTIDNSNDSRGFWVVTSSAKYWLGTPCSKVLSVPKLRLRSGDKTLGCGGERNDEAAATRAELPSQEQLHSFHQAQLGLFCNLFDILILPNGSYNTYLHNLSLKDVDKILTPSTQDVVRFHRKWKSSPKSVGVPTLYLHAFDLKLLETSRFLLPHIRSIHPSVGGSRWFKDLLQITVPETPQGALQNSTSEEYWIFSARKANSRSHRLSNGALDYEQIGETLDLLYPFELEIRYRIFSASEMGSCNGDGIGEGALLPNTLLPSLDASKMELRLTIEQMKRSKEDLCNRSTAGNILEPSGAEQTNLTPFRNINICNRADRETRIETPSIEQLPPVPKKRVPPSCEPTTSKKLKVEEPKNITEGLDSIIKGKDESKETDRTYNSQKGHKNKPVFEKFKVTGDGSSNDVIGANSEDLQQHRNMSQKPFRTPPARRAERPGYSDPGERIHRPSFSEHQGVINHGSKESDCSPGEHKVPHAREQVSQRAWLQYRRAGDRMLEQKDGRFGRRKPGLFYGQSRQQSRNFYQSHAHSGVSASQNNEQTRYRRPYLSSDRRDYRFDQDTAGSASRSGLSKCAGDGTDAYYQWSNYPSNEEYPRYNACRSQSQGPVRKRHEDHFSNDRGSYARQRDCPGPRSGEDKSRLRIRISRLKQRLAETHRRVSPDSRSHHYSDGGDGEVLNRDDEGDIASPRVIL